MSTSTQNPPVEPPKPDHPDHHDEYAGAFGFFRRYQKFILYTAGIFALITFSITGAMTQWMRGMTSGPTGPQPTITVGGRTVEIELEDQQMAALLARNARVLPPNVLPAYVLQADTGNLVTRLAVLRRASLACGLGVSSDEADRAIDWLVRLINNTNKSNDSATQIALSRGMNSLAEYRTLVMEAMRIGQFVLLASLGVDTGDSAVVAQLLEGEDREKITCNVATFDMKALAKELQAQGTVTEDDVRAWMMGKTDPEKSRLEVFDTNKVALRVGIIRFDAFDATQWPEILESFEWGDEQRAQLYKMEMTRFQDENGKPKPLDDADVVQQLDKIGKVNEVLSKILADIAKRQGDALKPLQDAYNQNMQERILQEQDRKAAQAKLDADPENAELKDALLKAEETLTAKQTAEETAKTVFESARSSFDFGTVWAELTKDRAGVELREIPGENNAAALKDLSAIDLGEWKRPEIGTNLTMPGQIASVPALAEKGGMILQATAVQVRPMKPWEDIKKNLEDKLFEEKSKNLGDEAKKKLTDELLRLGKEQAADKVAEIEQKKDAEVDRRFKEWEAGIQTELAEANQNLAKIPAGTEANRSWDQKRQRLEAELTASEKRRETFAKLVDSEIEAEVRAEAKKHYAAVLEPAAQAAGFTVELVGPYRRDLQQEPNFQKRYQRTVVFLWGGLVRQLKQDESTDVLEDTVERRWQIAACTKVEPLTVADLSRREFSLLERNFPILQTMKALEQSFTLEALKARYHYHEPEGRQISRD